MILEQNQEIFERQGVSAYHRAGLKGQGKKIAMIDSNYNIHDPVLGGNVFRPVPDSRPWRFHGHYTCQVIRQVLPEAEIYTFNRWNDALRWAINNEPDAVTASRSSNVVRLDPEFQRLSGALHEKGVPLFTSAGNEEESWMLMPPARLKEWIAVGAVAYIRGRLRLADYSSFTRDVQEEIWEMVEVVNFTNIYIRTFSDPERIHYYPGTSCSCPMQAAMSVLFSHQRDFSREKMYKYSIPLEDNLEFCRTYGFGLFQLPEPKEIKPDIFYRVVTGSFTDRALATYRMQELSRAGFKSFLLAFEHEARLFFRVVTGSFQVRENAENRVAELDEKGFSSFIAIYER